MKIAINMIDAPLGDSYQVKFDRGKVGALNVGVRAYSHSDAKARALRKVEAMRQVNDKTFALPADMAIDSSKKSIWQPNRCEPDIEDTP